MKVADAKKMRDSLKKSFKEWFSTVTVQDQATNSYNAAAGTVSITHAISITADAYLSPYKAMQLGGEILAGDVQILLMYDTNEIRPNAKVTCGATEYTVINTMPTTKDNRVTQKLHCRAANA